MGVGWLRGGDRCLRGQQVPRAHKSESCGTGQHNNQQIRHVRPYVGGPVLRVW